MAMPLFVFHNVFDFGVLVVGTEAESAKLALAFVVNAARGVWSI